MKLVKSLLLGSAAGIAAVSFANAADLPSKKAAPASYVKICDAYGAGFFYIPGSDTCVKIGGRVRADYAYTPAQDAVTQKYTAAAVVKASSNPTTVANYSSSKWGTSAVLASTESTQGFEARGRVDIDARTQTAFGTVQAVTQLRMNTATGMLNQTGYDAKTSQAQTLERAYIRFAGFTAGRSSEITAFMPSNALGFGGHWASYANGVMQLSYTAVLGGGLSATIGIEDPSDFNNVAAGSGGIGGLAQDTPVAGTSYTAGYRMNKAPVIAGNVTLEQSWGSVGVAGSAIQNNYTVVDGQAIGNTAVSVSKTGYSVTGNVMLKLPMLGAGDQLWLTAGYSEGFNDQTLGWGNFKSSDTKNLVGGLVYTPASYYVWGVNSSGVVVDNSHGTTYYDHYVAEQTKAFNVAGVLQHYWSADWRSNLMASYASTNPGTVSKATSFALGGLAKQQFSTVAANVIWSPTKGFDIGLEAQYQNVHTDLNAADVDATIAGLAVKSSVNNWGSRLRLERNF